MDTSQRQTPMADCVIFNYIQIVHKMEASFMSVNCKL